MNRRIGAAVLPFPKRRANPDVVGALQRKLEDLFAVDATDELLALRRDASFRLQAIAAARRLSAAVILSFLARRAGFPAFRSGRPAAHVLAARTRERRKCFA